MPIEVPPALLDAGGWVFAAVILVGVLSLIVTGRLVPGSVLASAEARERKATAQLERQAEAYNKLVTQLQVLISVLADSVENGRR